MKPSTVSAVTQILREFAIDQLPKLTRWSLKDIGHAYPFHRLFFPDEAILASRVERSVVTSMGNSLYPQLAAAIARDRHKSVSLGRTIEGTVNDAAINMIEQIVTELRSPPRTRDSDRIPDHRKEMRDILESRGGGQSLRTVTADLYVDDFEGGPLFIELKSPLPNLDVAAESKRKILYYLTIKDRQDVAGSKAFLGLTYNPFLTRAKYKHNFTKRIMDMENQVLIGSELWDYLGGPETYHELLAMIEQIRNELPEVE